MIDCAKTGHTIVIDKGIVPTCKKTGLSEGAHCSVCKEVIRKQYKISNLHDFRPTKIDKANGIIYYTCTGCSYVKEFPYSDPAEQEVYTTIISMKNKYPEGMRFDNNTSYVSDKIFPAVTYTGGGCVAFAMEMSDAAFGNLPGRIHFDFSKLRVGDIIRFLDNSHSAVVLAVNGDVITIAEANYNSTVHWGRTLKLSDGTNGWTYVITRYPE